MLKIMHIFVRFINFYIFYFCWAKIPAGVLSSLKKWTNPLSYLPKSPDEENKVSDSKSNLAIKMRPEEMTFLNHFH